MPVFSCFCVDLSLGVVAFPLPYGPHYYVVCDGLARMYIVMLLMIFQTILLSSLFGTNLECAVNKYKSNMLHYKQVQTAVITWICFKHVLPFSA